jgi:pimeloyl-ACP methyl ester carboxylesterase
MGSNRKLRSLLYAPMMYVAFCTVAGIYLADDSLHPPRRTLTEEETAAFRQSVDVLHGQLRDVAITSADGLALKGWMVTPPHSNDETVLLLHGLGDNRLGMTGYAQFLLAHGFTVLLPDARAHGNSGGSLATFGLLEGKDITQWVQFLRAQTRARCVYGMGESMGAAQLLQSLSSGAGFCAIIAESSFSTFREIAYDRMGQSFHLGPWVGRTLLWAVVESAFLRARWKYGLDMDSASPEDSVARTQVPVLLIHGQVDSNIPVRHSRLIHEWAPNTSLWEVPGADHCGALSAAPDQFKRVLLTWFSHDSPLMKHIAVQ